MRGWRRHAVLAGVPSRIPLIGVVVLALLLAACADAPAAAPTAVATPPPTEPPAASDAPADVGALRFAIGEGSQATVRVREQLANLPAPNDAVLTTSAVTGGFTLNPNGGFTSDSKISVDLRTLRSDSTQRDSFIQRNTLETSRFPTADFVPVTARGLVLPLPDGEFRFDLVGQMTIRGVTREVTFAVTARREGSTVRAIASNAPSWKFGDFELEQPNVFSVLSIADEIRLEVEVVANPA
jgi:polyisoprenoid-binding protein YceI